MANVILPNERRRADAEYIVRKYGIDTRDPAMREAAEVAAARTNEAVGMAEKKRRYF